ncbi:WYL domain-containing protein, partial [Eubacteriales bacterium OttesenSCG-928-M02]|nr:WYL domain-containing protein [Eubacteriales bacterium OttesenSCG-928-M02]
LVMREGRYYLFAFQQVGYSGRRQCFFEVERIEKVSIGLPMNSGNINFFSKRIDIDKYQYMDDDFCCMFPDPVIIQFPNEHINEVIRRFGLEVQIQGLTEESFEAVVMTPLSPKFFGWVFSLGSQVKILSPETLVKKFKDGLQDTYKIYTIPRNRKKKDDRDNN